MGAAAGTGPAARRWNHMRIRSMAVVVAVPVVFGLAACGGKAGDDGIASAVGGTAKQSASASPSQTLNPQDAALKFAQCMRQNGIDVPDPRPGQGIQLRVNRGSEAKFRAAQEACRQYAPGGGDKGTTSVG